MVSSGTRAELDFRRAQTSLQQAIARNTAIVQQLQQRPRSAGLGHVQRQVDQLRTLQTKLDQRWLRIAVFGLVSRGKSAVINALLGKPIMQTGPLNGVTQWTQSVYWDVQPAIAAADQHPLMLELTDTPGLDEIDGEARATLAQTVAQQSDLILFVVAGDITQTEYQALCDLRRSQKPILLVFNKIDLYPDRDRRAILAKLQQLGQQQLEAETHSPIMSPEQIVMVAASPAALEVRVEWPDGRVTQEWETPPPQIDALRTTLRSRLSQDGLRLLALNTLCQVQAIEVEIARTVTTDQDLEAAALVRKFAKYKAIAVAVNPIGFLDLVGGFVTDLLLIRALARLYGLPMTGYEAGQLWRTILKSSGGTLLSEIGSGILMGVTKAAAFTQIMENPGSLVAIAGTWSLQAAAAVYGTYAVGKAAQVYLEQGCTWGPQGASTIVQDIVSQIRRDHADLLAEVWADRNPTAPD